jgi:plastocyanin
MRLRFLVMIATLFLLASNVLAKDVYLSIAGTVSNFHTDARIFNPSGTKDITVQAYFLPAGITTNNSGVQPVAVTVPKRSMKVLDDVVTAVFSASGVGAIRLTSDDDFVATSRIYAQVSSGTLGQFVQGLDATTAVKNGVLVQIKSNTAFRTNIGAANPNNTTANVTWHLYDKNNAIIGTAKTDAFAPYSVLGPTNVAGYLNAPAGTDLSDAWVSFTSDQPIFAYVSVLDNGTTDPTYIPASPDSGSSSQTSSPNTKTFSVTESSGVINISPDPSAGNIQVGDTVVFRIVSTDFTHGFEVFAPDSSISVPDTHIAPNLPAIVKQFTVTQEGTYQYLCTISTCSSGHVTMNGTFVIGTPSDPVGHPGY